MRAAKAQRQTKETSIIVRLFLDGTGVSEIHTGIGFLDHMLTLFSMHGKFDLQLECNGDLEVDGHHTTEDVGIVLGQTFKTALGDKRGIARYGTFFLPMDEAMAFVSADISGRAFLLCEPGELSPTVGDFDTELVTEFLRAFAFNAGITLHAKVLYGNNTHHKIEALFKALGRALAIAVAQDPRETGIPSSKGVL